MISKSFHGFKYFQEISKNTVNSKDFKKFPQIKKVFKKLIRFKKFRSVSKYFKGFLKISQIFRRSVFLLKKETEYETIF